MDRISRGRYADLTLLGEGGMGSVYRAHDTVRDSIVALKALRLDEGTRHRELLIAQFHQEYRTLAELAHPCVIQVFDYGVDSEGPYYTMELLDGADLVRRAPLPWREACSLLRDVSSSLALLHSRGFVHRDVSPLNVRCTDDGRAKLIDFGAMIPMGVNTVAMGTPPCVAPEVLNRQPLDGRTDLFALGATLYFTLTRRHAYPAHSFGELLAAHKHQVRPPTHYASDVPPALDRLVLSLLSLDPMARPRHAAEVMDRLSVIASLEPIEAPAVRGAYLFTPALIGREAATSRTAEILADARQGRGHTVRVHAAPGGGCSRVLHAAIMEARLAGMLVLQAQATHRGRSYAVLRVLLRDLRDGSSRGAAEIEQRPELKAVLEASPSDLEVGPRESTLRAFAQLIAEMARERPLLIAIDDIEHCDEPSLAALVTVASAVRKRAIAIAYTDSDREPRDLQRALSLLRELSSTIELPPLTLPHVEALLGSVFGTVPNLQSVSRFIYDRALGSPLPTMELAQAIVDRGLARYELGSWSLPSQLDVDAVPPSLLGVRSAKLEGLSEDAREFAEFLAVADDYVLSLDDLCRLSEHHSYERLEKARASLIEARVVLPGELQALADRSWRDLACASLGRARAAALHGRLAQLLHERAAPPIRVARCWLRAGDEARALDVLCSALQAGTLVEGADADYVEILQASAAACRRLARPPLDGYRLARELMRLSDRVIVGDGGDCFRAVLERVRHDSGLADWEALPEGPDRLNQALTAVQARYDAAEPRERVLAPVDAIRELVETAYDTAVYAAILGDMALLDEVPDLSPFEPLSPAIAQVRSAVESQRPLIGACYDQVLEVYEARLGSLQSSRGILTEAQFARALLLLHYALGSLQAGLSIQGALEHAAALDELPHGQILAAAVRESYYVRRGSTRAAEEWRRRMELLQIQLKRPHSLKLRQAAQQLECAGHSDDLEEVKHNLEVFEELSLIFRSAVPYLHYARAEYERIRGDYATGLRHAQESLRSIQAGEHPAWPWVAGCEVDCLRLLGRNEEARSVGIARVRDARQAGMRVLADHIETFVAAAETDLGALDDAAERLDRIIRYREEFNIRGIALGWVYEARADVALRMRDRASFELYLAKCAENYAGGRNNPALAARHDRLLQNARSSLGLSGVLLSNPPLSEMSSVSATACKRTPPLADCKDGRQRAEKALAYLLATANCDRGWLYLVHSGALELAAGDGETAEHRRVAEEFLERYDDDEMCTADDADESEPSSRPEAAATSFRPFLLTTSHEDRSVTIGVLLLVGASAYPADFYEAVREVCDALLESGDLEASA